MADSTSTDTGSLGDLLALLPALGITGYSLANGGFFPNAQTTQNREFDPTAQALNLARLNQIQSGISSSGGLGQFLNPNQPSFNLSPTTQGFVNKIGAVSYTHLTLPTNREV